MSRQIDHMTPQELDTLHVKGMLGSKPHQSQPGVWDEKSQTYVLPSGMKYLIGLTIIILALPFLILATITNAIMDALKPR